LSCIVALKLSRLKLSSPAYLFGSKISSPKHKAVSVQLPIGEIVGRQVDQVSTFYGYNRKHMKYILKTQMNRIRYAKAPIGEKRWEAPDTQEPLWESPLLAFHLPDSCPQIPGVGISEDCLFLNIVAPSIDDTTRKAKMRSPENLPVMIWIHGGAFVFGNNWQWGLYNQKPFVQENNLIVVTINYRIGALGYLVCTNVALYFLKK
jgi:carboxylesterase type B